MWSDSSFRPATHLVVNVLSWWLACLGLRSTHCRSSPRYRAAVSAAGFDVALRKRALVSVARPGRCLALLMAAVRAARDWPCASAGSSSADVDPSEVVSQHVGIQRVSFRARHAAAALIDVLVDLTAERHVIVLGRGTAQGT